MRMNIAVDNPQYRIRKMICKSLSLPVFFVICKAEPIQTELVLIVNFVISDARFHGTSSSENPIASEVDTLDKLSGKATQRKFVGQRMAKV